MKTVFLVLVLLAIGTGPAAADVAPDTVAAWNRYVAHAAAHLYQSRAAQPEGIAVDIPGGTVHHWRGSTVVRGTDVDRVLRALMHPGTPPPQDDVVDSRVLARQGNSLRVYLKLRRTTVVTVVYDTEHDVVFHRHAPGVATSRSVSTRIAEVGGGDRGFLWRLNSYWRYTQVGNNVRVDVESLSLSRDVPWFARSIAEPIIHRIARESLARTLASVRRFLEDGAGSA